MADPNEKKITICYSDFECFKDNQIKPRDFIAWAKSDFKGGDKRSLGNTLDNIKKALHSRIDEIILATHIPYADDWSWHNISTETKLKILTKLGMEHTAVARLITDIRNKYEHKYVLPKKPEVEANLSTAELWIDDSYRKYGCNRIGIAELRVIDVVQENNEITRLELPGYRNFTYFWDRKRELHKAIRGKPMEVIRLNEITWNEILNEERPYIRSVSRSKHVYFLSRKKMTRLYNYYTTKISKTFDPLISINLNLKSWE